MAVPKDAITFYWCTKHAVPLFEKKCTCYQNEENERVEAKSVWHNGYCYIVDGEKFRISIEALNIMSLDKIEVIRTKVIQYADDIDYTYFNQIIDRFKIANKLRLESIMREPRIRF